MTRTIMTQRAPAPMTPVHKTRWDGPGLGEFIAMMAALMAVNPLAIDSMLPALPAIGDALNVSEDNRRQLVITAYLIGFGGAQLLHGPNSDRLGSETILAGSLFFFGRWAERLVGNEFVSTCRSRWLQFNLTKKKYTN